MIGGNGSDTIIGSPDADAFVVTSNRAGSVTGQIISFSSMDHLDGADGSDSLTANSTIEVTALNAGHTNSSNITWSNIENLVGTASGNTFRLRGGTIDGMGGTDALSAETTGSTFVVTAANEGAIDSIPFVSIETLNGNVGNDVFQFAGGSITSNANASDGTDTLFADDSGIDFMLTGAGQGTAGALLAQFLNFENLTGGAGNDEFTLAGGSILGEADGGAGTDCIHASKNGEIFNITAPNTGSVTGAIPSFSDIETLVGGSSADLYVFAAAGTINSIEGFSFDDSIDATDLIDPSVTLNPGDDLRILGYTRTVEIAGGQIFQSRALLTDPFTDRAVLKDYIGILQSDASNPYILLVGPPLPPCEGDANADRVIDVNDISYVLFRLGNPCPK